MASTAPAVTAGKKRKRPPTFSHLPINRAKKLKQSWVEVQKIKSKWKAQKRKEGLVGANRGMALPEVENNGEEDAISRDEGKDEKRAGSEQEDGSGESAAQEADSEEGVESGHEDGDESENESGEANEASNYELQIAMRQVNQQDQKKENSRGRRERERGGSTKKIRPDTHPEEKPSLRELQNRAYSRFSLHNFKSRFSNKYSSAGPVDRERGRGRDLQSTRGRGRGQPDMRLRMNAMLEKIKRDFA